VTPYHVDALAALFVLQPESLDVVVGSNLFGDILTDLGIPASANLNPERRFSSLFEPVHGSAPDIAGRGVASPTAAIWAGAMTLEHLDANDAAQLVMKALERAGIGAFADARSWRKQFDRRDGGRSHHAGDELSTALTKFVGVSVDDQIQCRCSGI
jgi:isocitrate/isopropylmalate dehydrogenase